MKGLNLKNLPEIVAAINREKRYLERGYGDEQKLKSLKEEFTEKASALEEVLKKEQGKAKERIFTAHTLCEILGEVEEKVSTKKALNGTKVYYDFGQKFPNAYKYTPYSTHMAAEYRNGSWRLVHLERGICPNHSQAGHIEFSEAAQADIISRASAI